MGTIGTVTERLARNRYAVDHEASHIEIDQDLARENGLLELLTRVCPAHVYSQGPDDTIVVQHAACLECGACFALAGGRGLSWHYPRGGFGVAYREG
jgi:ferredoxin like protein